MIKDKAIPVSWEENKKGKIGVLMPNAKIIRGNSDLDIKKIKDENIVFFRGLGYARYNLGEKVKFWFAHN